MIYVEQGIVFLLSVLSVWDLYKKEMPTVLLMILSLAAVWKLADASFWNRGMSIILVVLMGSIGLWFGKNGKMGTGDIWVFCILAAVWSVEVFWSSVFNGVLLLCLVAMGVWIYTKNEKERIPVLPFLMLGYWMRGS